MVEEVVKVSFLPTGPLVRTFIGVATTFDSAFDFLSIIIVGDVLVGSDKAVVDFGGSAVRSVELIVFWAVRPAKLVESVEMAGVVLAVTVDIVVRLVVVVEVVIAEDSVVEGNFLVIKDIIGFVPLFDDLRLVNVADGTYV